MLPRFCLDYNFRSAFAPGGSSVLRKMEIAKRSRQAKVPGEVPNVSSEEWKSDSLGARRCEVPAGRKGARHVSAEEPRLRVLHN